MSGDDLLLIVAGLGAGVVNGIAGGGSLVSFPALLALGHPAVVANVTSTVGIWPGYLGGSAGFRGELVTQVPRIRRLAPAALAGGLAGSCLLLVTPADLFGSIAPFLILAACGLFAGQPWLSRRVAARRAVGPGPPGPGPAGPGRADLVGTVLASVYGGYFGAGLGVILLAVLGLTLDDTLARINGLRGVLALLINSIAVAVFVVGADVAWRAAGLLAVTSFVGGYLGARTSLRMPAPVLRSVVVLFGLVAAGKLLVS